MPQIVGGIYIPESVASDLVLHSLSVSHKEMGKTFWRVTNRGAIRLGILVCAFVVCMQQIQTFQQ